MHRLALLSLTPLTLVLTIQCAPRNVTAVKKEKHANATEEIEKTGEFDLTKLGELDEAQFNRVYFQIINTMKRMGPESLNYMNRTDVLETAFVADSRETPEEVQERWQGFCDFYKLDGNLYQFRDFVMSRVYKPPPPGKRVKKPPTHLRTLLETEDAVPVKKKK